ncbi:hypothetical protein [Amycolatopsis jiangsuensis]|uniref:Uncharacterized protein n=1 Tax=Amycolatopsis jiangsuensis TaxID=1181879 RepID=A0A840J1S7_9PSEU|nr:hypothetical protein [Amycolatopsis jiangsuensis]MBB4687863.1 hypothetical protein [Amycolatopsis jiangsuensis]
MHWLPRNRGFAWLYVIVGVLLLALLLVQLGFDSAPVDRAAITRYVLDGVATVVFLGTGIAKLIIVGHED